MKKIYTAFAFIITAALSAQLNVDTLAFQDFEVSPASPTWNFTGPVVYNSGFSAPNAAPPNSPLGINGSRAWETTTNSSGLMLTFSNVPITGSYDSILVRFNLAGMNLLGSSGGPDHLDWVLVGYSLDNGINWVNRLRIRGAVNNNSFWPYSALGVAKVNHLPATESMFQPINSGLQLNDGIAVCEIVFPGTITQLQIRITARSSSSTDTWLIDNVVMTGENSCVVNPANLNAEVCYGDSFAFADGTIQRNITSNTSYTSTLIGAASSGCDSVIIQNLNVLSVDAGITQNGLVLSATNTNPGVTYQWYNCDGNTPISGETSANFTVTTNGEYAVMVTQDNCDSLSTCVLVDFVSVQNFQQSTIRIYPQPANTKLFWEGAKVDQHYQIYDLSGKLVFQNLAKSTEIEIDLSHLPAGMYFLHQDSYKQKFIVAKP
jgi:hypothetical protein